MAGEDHLGHGRHADGVGAERAEGADLGRRLEARAVRGEVDALGQRDAEAARRSAAAGRAAPGRRRRACSGSAGPTSSSLGPVSGLTPSMLMWSAIAISEPGGDSGRSEPAALVASSATRAGALQRAHRRAHRARVAALVDVPAALQDTRRAGRRAGRARAGRRGRRRPARGSPAGRRSRSAIASSAASASPPRPEPRISPSRGAKPGARRGDHVRGGLAAGDRRVEVVRAGLIGRYSGPNERGQQLLERHRRARRPSPRAGGRSRRAA